MTNRGKRKLRTRGGMWGPRRVELGISIRDLERESGVGRGVLSQIEGGRIVPTGAEFEAVMRVLREEELATVVPAAAAPPE